MDRKIVTYDTTLRDGTQGGGFSLSVEDKIKIAMELDNLHFDYIEGGWPGSNPKDIEFFKRAKDINFAHAKLAAFGSTRHKDILSEDDENLRLLVEAGTPVVTIFGKTSIAHVLESLQTSPDENLKMISDSVVFLKRYGKEVVYDAEHFFDGFESNRDYAIATLNAALGSSADWIVLCDTNGGTDFDMAREIMHYVKTSIPNCKLGIHPHDDIDYGTVNAITAIKEGLTMVQGTVNGYGERIGNGNLITIINNAAKLGYTTSGGIDLFKMTKLSKFVNETANINSSPKQHYVGDDAFAHKGGIHVSAVLKNPGLYEHMDPSGVGNRRRFHISELSGTSNLEAVFGINRKDPLARKIIDEIKRKEHEGYSYEDAFGSLKLLIERVRGNDTKLFSLLERKILDIKTGYGKISSKASVNINVNGDAIALTEEGNGPVNAMDMALRKLLISKYPELSELRLQDYKVRVLPGEEKGTADKVRVGIESSIYNSNFGTVGVGTDIIEASWEALVESYEYASLLHNKDMK
jgi:2-isopropylmalate synthase